MNGINGLCSDVSDISLLKIAERVGQTILTEPISNRYDVHEEIGRGKYAVVKRVVEKSSSRQYAAKFIKKRRRGKCCRSEIMHEIALLDVCLANARIVHMKEVYETTHDIIVIMEYAAGGELYHHCAVEESLSEQDSQKIVKQTLEALKFLHERNIVHLDIKPSNILLMNHISTRNMDVKLCDFSFARLIDTSADIREILGTPDYVAPEILSYEPIHTSADIWSLGVLTYVMLTGHSPFLGDTKQETFLNISQLNYDFPDDLWSDISKDAQNFIKSILMEEPGERPTASQLLNHAWIRGVTSPSRSGDVILTSIQEEDDVIATSGVGSAADVINGKHDIPEIQTETETETGNSDITTDGSRSPEGSRSPLGTRRSLTNVLECGPSEKKIKMGISPPQPEFHLQQVT